MHVFGSKGPFLSLLIPDCTMGSCEVSFLKRDGELEPAGASTWRWCPSAARQTRLVGSVLKLAGLKRSQRSVGSISMVFHESVLGSDFRRVHRIKLSEESLKSGFPLVRLQRSPIVIL